MNNNRENYKNAINEIHASDELKNKTLESINQSKKTNLFSLKVLATVAAVFVICLFGFDIANNQEFKHIAVKDNKENDVKNEIEKEIILANAELNRFESIEELKKVLKEEANNREIYFNDSVIFESAMESDSVAQSTPTFSSQNKSEAVSDLRGDYSTTNVQVQNVDEADVVKTDGEYIYYVSNNRVNIIKADGLDVLSEIRINTDTENFFISEIFLKDDKLITIGDFQIIEENEEVKDEYRNSFYYRSNVKYLTKAIVYDISDRSNPIKLRDVALDGNYVNSRMVGDNLYFISRNHKYYYENISEYEILPIIYDSVIGEENKTVECTDIIYFKNTNDTSFMMVGGFNINEDDEVYVETFFGAGSLVYSDEDSLYLTRTIYNEENKTIIYKFLLDNSRIMLQASGEVDGSLNNQFSMDEYNGNLRLATTSRVVITPDKFNDIGEGISKVTRGETTTVNNLIVLDENLKEIGRIDNLAEGEKIYSVRFMGNVGYMVTFKQIDPLFVIDLSDPTNPTVKGELKIPGYSSYLHPYDETHIIGIGYNTKDNGWGGETNSNMKMSMFDVSDLENPQEIFNVDIGTDYAYSEITHNHKVLFYKASEDLIGFPVRYNSNDYRDNTEGFVIFKINLENNEFETYGEIMKPNDYRSNVQRIIYIGDVLYELSTNNIVSYDLNTFEKIDEVTLDENDDNYNAYIDVPIVDGVIIN